MKTKFVKETDKKGKTYIIEVEQIGNVRSVNRFICEVQQQETEIETRQIADLLLLKLNA